MRSRSTRTALVATCAALALSACREDERSPDAAVGYGVAPSALAYDMALAPDGLALPAAGPAPIGRPVSYDDGYAWAERAYAMDRAFYDAPPDYGFAYDEVEPWVWESEDRWAMYAEPISDGYRYYYYEPGEDHPYFVRDADYGYGYDDAGRLVTLYTVAGVLLPVSYLDDRADLAGRYWSRAHDLRRAATREHRARINQDRWLARQPVFVRSQRPWMDAAVRRDDWRGYRERHQRRDVRRFEPERLRREAVVQRLNRNELRQAEGGRRGDRREEGRQVAVLKPREDRRWEWGGRRNDDDRRGSERRVEERRDRGERDGRHQQQAPAEIERRAQPQIRAPDARRQQARAESERRGRDEMQARQEQRRQQLAQVEAERRGRDARGQQARGDTERRGREQAQQAQRRQQAEQARNEQRGRQEAQVRERRGREQQARAEGERRGREQAQQAQRRQQAEQARNEQRGRQEAQMRERQGRKQQARAEGERRGREQSQAQQRAEQPQHQARQDARNAGQAARDAGGRERERGQGRGGRRED